MFLLSIVLLHVYNLDFHFRVFVLSENNSVVKVLPLCEGVDIGCGVHDRCHIHLVSIHELSVPIYFRMVNYYKEWAQRAMSEGWEFVTFARHKDHLPIVRGQLEPLKSLIFSVLSGDLVDGVDYEYAEEDQVCIFYFFCD